MELTAKTAEQNARTKSRGMPLRAVLASDTSLYETSGGGLFYGVDTWMFTYALSATDIVAISVENKGIRVEPSPAVEPALLQLPAISNWLIDSDQAYSLAQRSGGSVVSAPFGEPFFRRSMASVDGESTPVWVLPHRRQGLPVLVRADTGAEVFLKDPVSRLLTRHPR